MKIGEVIRRWRNDSQMTQEQLAKAARMRQSHLSMIEKGAYESPGILTLYPLVQALGHSLDELAELITANRDSKVAIPSLLQYRWQSYGEAS
jgi:transcriptional regulator with XRE-family HTH domain